MVSLPQKLRPSSLIEVSTPKVEATTASSKEPATSSSSQQQRPKSAFVIGPGSTSPRTPSKMRLSSPQRALQPLPGSVDLDDDVEDVEKEEAEGETDVNQASKNEKCERLSPEKDIALRTLDDVIQEAEESMGEYKLKKESYPRLIYHKLFLFSSDIVFSV